MRVIFDIQGADDLMKRFKGAERKLQKKVDMVTETYARKMANESGRAAPVLSGDLRTNIIASPNKLGPGLWEYGGTLPYTVRQEYEHKGNKGFIRRIVWNNKNAYKSAILREAGKL